MKSLQSKYSSPCCESGQLYHGENHALLRTETCCKNMGIKNDNGPGNVGANTGKHDCDKDKYDSITFEHVCNTKRTKAATSRTL